MLLPEVEELKNRTTSLVELKHTSNYPGIGFRLIFCLLNYFFINLGFKTKYFSSVLII